MNEVGARVTACLHDHIRYLLTTWGSVRILRHYHCFALIMASTHNDVRIEIVASTMQLVIESR